MNTTVSYIRKKKKLLDYVQPVRDKIDELTFGEIIRGCREAIGMKQYHLAEIMGMHWHKLKNLETNRFQDLPEIEDVRTFCEIFELELSKVTKAIEKQVTEHRARMLTTNKHPTYKNQKYASKRGVTCTFASKENQ